MNPLMVAGGTAVLVSKRGRNAVRQGVVYGLAGALWAGETLVNATRGATHTAEQAASAAGGTIASAARGVKHGAEEVTGGVIKEARAVREHAPTAEGEAAKPAQPQAGKPAQPQARRRATSRK
jgi:hypothetical protein